MTGFLVQLGTIIMCPHGFPIPTQAVLKGMKQVLASGMPVLTIQDIYPTTACLAPNAAGTGTQPCVTLQWTVSAQKVFIMNIPVLLNTAVGMCIGSLVPGPPVISPPQPKVIGS